jgi:predicted ArsR family transcriptional regulator
MFRDQVLATSRGRIVALMRRGGLTVDDIANELRLTANAVRTQITGMERDGMVRRVGRRPGTTRPSQIFELTPEVEQLMSRAYLPFLGQLLSVATRRLPARQVSALMRTVGKGLADELLSGGRPSGSLRARVSFASRMLDDQLGAVNHVEENGSYVIRGAGCPLSALTEKHPAVCLAVETLLTETIGAPVRQCCDLTERPRCCFEIEK